MKGETNMRKLQNESEIYIKNIINLIENCYANSEPTTSELMKLYNEIGEQICLQGEKYFIANLEELLKAEFPKIKGFSARNLRRMRDFFVTYKDKPSLVAKAEKLNFTINIVIMEKCGSYAEREFYLDLAIGKNLSKAGLVSAIENDEFSLQQICNENLEPVFNFYENQAVDTSENPIRIFSAVNSICRDFLQGMILYKFLQERLFSAVYPRGVPPELFPT